MLAYILRRLALIVPTLLGILTLNFFIIQAAPGGPVEQMIAQLQGLDVAAAARVSGPGGDAAGGLGPTGASRAARPASGRSGCRSGRPEPNPGCSEHTAWRLLTKFREPSGLVFEPNLKLGNRQ